MWREKVEMPEAGIGARPVDEGPGALSMGSVDIRREGNRGARAANAARGIKD